MTSSSLLSSKNPLERTIARTMSQKLGIVYISLFLPTCCIPFSSCIPFVREQNENREQSKGPVCQTQECVKLADEFLDRMDTSVSPCDDFYRYACGNYIKASEIPDHRRVVSTISALNDDLSQKLRDLVEQDIDQENASPTTQRLRNLYTSCMDLDTIEAVGDQPLNQLIRELGGWPVLRGNNNQTIDQSKPQVNWMIVLERFRQFGLSLDKLFTLDIGTDYMNNSMLAISIDNPVLGIPERNIMIRGLEDPIVVAYYNLMVDSAVYLGANKDDAKRQMLEVLEFEIELAEHSMPREQRRKIESLYNMMTLQELSTKTPNINWYKCFKSQMRVWFQPQHRVMVRVPDYVAHLNRLLGETDARTLQNFLIWRAVLETMPYLNKRWQSMILQFEITAGGQKVERPRWEQCVSLLKLTQGTAISSVFVRQHFGPELKKQVEKIVDYVKREFQTTLEQVDWIHDDWTRDEALIKLAKIRSHVGYPDELLDTNRVESIYAGLGTIYADRYFVNQLTLRRWHIDERFKVLTVEVPQSTIWRHHSEVALVNGHYQMVTNEIELPAGILSGVFFGPTRPNYLNFAGVGSLVGHEITHGFDDQGRQFDSQGNTRNWWDPVTDARFRQRAQCMIDQYSEYRVLTELDGDGAISLDGFNTQGENIADNGGLKVAFRAYERWARESGAEEPLLPKLTHMNQRQLFWLGTANVFCAKYRPELTKLLVLSDSHSPNEFRINGPLKNLAEFSETFNCPLGSPMNPEKKCLVW